jgi:two-component system chemotaxis response regulator CheB
MHDLIVIGTSAGGVEALRTVVAGLPPRLPAAVLVVMHMSPRSPHLLPQILRRSGPLEVAATIDGAPVQPGKVYVAPPDHHLLVKDDHIRLTKGPKENRSRPAIDPLFRTAAMGYGARVIGVILTGMLDDGTAGLAAVRERGGLSIVQDPDEALYSSMPRSAVRRVGADFVARLIDIPPLLTTLVGEPEKPAPGLPLSRLREVEFKFDQMEVPTMEDLDAIGSRAALTCPECHGPLWKIADPTLQRFRCLIGHAYTAQGNLEAQIDGQENYLSQALRLMKERASLILELMATAEDAQTADERAMYEAQLKQLKKNMSIIQAMLEENGSPAADLSRRND